MKLQVGDMAPEIELLTDSGVSFKLSGLKGKKVVLYFYPRSNTPGCTVESKEFRDAVSEFEKKGAVVVGVSPDTVKAQAGFKAKFELGFTLLADFEKVAVQDYGVWKEKNMYGKKVMGVARTTFLIGETGKIERIFEKVKPEGHAGQVLCEL